MSHFAASLERRCSHNYLWLSLESFIRGCTLCILFHLSIQGNSLGMEDTCCFYPCMHRGDKWGKLQTFYHTLHTICRRKLDIYLRRECQLFLVCILSYTQCICFYQCMFYTSRHHSSHHSRCIFRPLDRSNSPTSKYHSWTVPSSDRHRSISTGSLCTQHPTRALTVLCTLNLGGKSRGRL